MTEMVECRTPELVVYVEDPLLRHFLRLAQLAIEEDSRKLHQRSTNQLTIKHVHFSAFFDYIQFSH